MNAKTEGIWVWTAKAEEIAKALNLDERKENSPARLGYGLLGQYAPKAWITIGYVKESPEMESIIEENIPKGSSITGTDLETIYESTFLQIYYTVTKEYQVENDLSYRSRILQIRIIRGEGDYGLPITSFAANN